MLFWPKLELASEKLLKNVTLYSFFDQKNSRYDNLKNSNNAWIYDNLLQRSFGRYTQ